MASSSKTRSASSSLKEPIDPHASLRDVFASAADLLNRQTFNAMSNIGIYGAICGLSPALVRSHVISFYLSHVFVFSRTVIWTL